MRKIARDCRWNLWRTKRKRIGEKLRRKSVKNWGEKKKWTEAAVGGIYMAVLPTDSQTDIKLIIILIYSIGEVSKIRL